jgi:hypothetical protein
MGLIFHVLVDREEDYQNNVKRHDLQILVENYKPLFLDEKQGSENGSFYWTFEYQIVCLCGINPVF